MRAVTISLNDLHHHWPQPHSHFDTHQSYSRIHTLSYQSLLHTCLFTFVSTGITIAYCRPREIDACATAWEEEIVLWVRKEEENMTEDMGRNQMVVPSERTSVSECDGWKWAGSGQKWLTLNLSFLAVGPPYPNSPTEVPLIAMITVEFVESAN